MHERIKASQSFDLMAIMLLRSVLILVVTTIALAKVVPKDGDANWWKHAVFYQIYPRSFKDSNNDGMGDFKGITSKLEHLVDAGVDALWLSPIYSSPGVDAGYDISNYTDVNPEFGTMEDFDELLTRAKELGLKVILDYVPNHTSDEHEWFKKSAAREPGYDNYYVWLDGQKDNTQPPNNWVSYFHGSAWQYSETRGQWYLHQFAIGQPDLNYRDPRLVQEMKDVLTFWLDKGVDGFRVDTIPSLVEVDGYPDEPLSNDPNSTPEDYGYLLHPYTNDQPETYDMVYQWRELLDKYAEENGGDARVMMTESYSPIDKVMGYYGNATHNGAHFTFNFLFIKDLNSHSSARDIKFIIDKWLTYMPYRFTPNWVLGNHDNNRVATRYGSDRVDGLTMLEMFLPGVGVTYNGEEIGMEDGEITWEDAQDPQACNGRPEDLQTNSRDYERTPYQWDDSVNAGFNEGAKPWLPVSEKYLKTNLAEQSQPEAHSHYKVYQKLIQLRKTDVLKHGELNSVALSDTVLLLTRELRSQETLVLVINIGNREEEVDLNVLPEVTPEMELILTGIQSTRQPNDIIQSKNLVLVPYESLLMTTKLSHQ